MNNQENNIYNYQQPMMPSPPIFPNGAWQKSYINAIGGEKEFFSK